MPEAREATTSRRSPRPEFVCPRTGSSLVWDEAGIVCPATGERWERIGDVPVFTTADVPDGSDDAHLDHPDTPPLVPDADSLGWEEALRRAGVADRPAESANDWRFLVPLDETSRVLVLERGWGDVTAALAPEAGFVAVSAPEGERARFIEIRARQSRLDNVVACATPPSEIPFPDATFDLAVGGSEALDALPAIRRKLAPGGSLWISTDNHHALPTPLGRPDTGPDDRPALGLDAIRKRLAAEGFGRVRVWAVAPSIERPSEWIPLDDPTVFDWLAERRGGPSALGRARAVLSKWTFRAGALPRLAAHWGLLATMGGER